MLREKWPRALLLVGSVGFALVIAEIGLRVLGSAESPSVSVDVERNANNRFFQYDERLGWSGRPYASGEYEGINPFQVSLNSHGLRDREVSFEKTAGRIRILVLGDSQTWGFGVSQQQRYSDVLQRLLREKGLNVEVLNFGMNGYGTDQELLLFNELGKQYHPDFVLLGFFWNDLFENTLASAYGYPKPLFVENSQGSGLDLTNVPVPRASRESKSVSMSRRGLKDWLQDHSYVYRVAEKSIDRSSRLYQLAVRIGLAAGPRRDPNSKEWRRTSRLLDLLRDSVEASSAQFLVVVIPERADFSMGTHTLRKPLLDEMQKQPMLDAFPAMKTAGSEESLYYSNDIHLKPKGHEILGRVVFDYLIRMKKLEASASQTTLTLER